MRLYGTFLKNFTHTINNFFHPEDVLVKKPVRYGAIRQDIKTGDIMVSSVGTGVNLADIWFGRLISSITGYKIYHVGMVIKLENRYFVLEAMVPQVRLSLLSNRLPFDIIKVNEKVPMQISDHDFKTKALGYLGIPYSLVDVVKSYFKNELPKDNGVHCVELTRILLKMGYDMDTKSLIPGEFCKELTKLGFNSIKVK